MKDVARAVCISLILLATLGHAGCGPRSVFPLVSNTDIQFDSLLVGAWQDSDSGSVVITKESPSRYSIVYTDSAGRIGHFRGTLGRMKTLRILDLEPEAPRLEVCDTSMELLLPLHLAFFVDSIGAELRVRLLEADELEQYVQRHPLAITHLMRDGDVILTAQTADLQRFLVSYVGRAGALSESCVWVRRSP